MNGLNWTWLPEPQRPGYDGDPSCMQDPRCCAALLMDDGTVTVYGDWATWTNDEGCGCCAGGRYDAKIVAWAPLNIEPPTRPEP